MDNIVYDVSKVTIMWGSMYITGLSDSSEIKIAANGDAVTPKTGIQGDTVYAVNPDKSATATLSLFAVASILPVLRSDARNHVRRTLTIRQSGSGGFTQQCANCMITKIPDIVRGKEGGSVEVSIYIPEFNPME